MAKRLLAAMAGIAFLMTLAYYSGSLRSERAMEQEKDRLLAQIESLELLTKEQAAAPGDRVQADTAASGGRKTQVKMEETGSEEPAKFRFFIKEADGLVNIYREDGTTLYETTDIPVSLLPEALRREISAGKGVATEQELYDFLENYSS